MEVSDFLSTTARVSVNPLKDDTNISALKTFEEILRTSIGPHGKLKIIKNASGGCVTVTSSSQRLFHIISIKNIFLKLIAASVRTHLQSFNDHGLCCSLLATKLIINSLSTTYPLPVIGALIEYFGKIFIECLNIDVNSCVFNIDLTSLANFQSVARTILNSKPGCILKKEDKDHLCVLLMKAYLNCLPPASSTIVYKNINFVTLEGTSCDKSCLYDGLLLRLSEIPHKNLTHLYSITDIKIVLFTTSLSGDTDFPVSDLEVTNGVDVWESVLIFIKNFIQQLISAEIHILACQKVVHPSLKKQLENANILVLDRLGHETSKHLEYLSGASNSTLFCKPCFGVLTSISKVNIGRKEFLLFSNKSKAFMTMLICNFNEQAVNETKVVCEQVFNSLIYLLKKPMVCFGAGCTEIHTSLLMQQKVLQSLDAIQLEMQCSLTQILEALQIFHQSIIDLTTAFHQDSPLNFTTESVNGHLWKLKDGTFPSNNDTCLCGQFSASGISTSDWKIFSKSTNNHFKVSDFCPAKIKVKVDGRVLLDVLGSKINAYLLAFETAQLLLRTSVCVLS